MALSLNCQECNARLRNVAEMQAHTEATNHTSFAESTEPVLNFQCKECGKPCRSQTEQDLHTKRTGHQEYVDKTAESHLIETETEMVEARKKIKEDADAASGASQPPEMMPPSVNTEVRQQLEDMGFSANKATRALHFSGTDSLEQALNWIEAHENDPDGDEPLLVPKEAPKVKLSAEEARKQAEELIRKAKAKKEKEERELERLREQERVRAGKELLAAKKLEDDLRLKRNLEERKREKEEEARAKEKIRLKLAEDRAERRRKLGLPVELTAHEEAAEKAKQTEKEAAQRKLPVALKPVSQLEKMREALVAVKKQAAGDEARASTAFQTMLKYIGNVAQNPQEDRFRTIKLSNAAFQSRVAALPASLDFFAYVGFRREGNVLVLPAESARMETLNAAGEVLNNAITNPMFGAL